MTHGFLRLAIGAFAVLMLPMTLMSSLSRRPAKLVQRAEGFANQRSRPGRLRMTCAATVAFLVAFSAHALPLSDYIASLERVQAHLGAKQLEAAKAEAAKLKGVEVDWAGGRFRADDTLLAEIGRATDVGVPLMTRLELTIGELRRGTGVEGTRANPNVLQRVAAEQKVGELARGGEIRTTAEGDAPLLARIGESIGAMFRWLGKKIRNIIDWIVDLLPGNDDPIKRKSTAGMRWIVIGVTVLIAALIALLAFEVVRRARRRDAETIAASEPLGSKRDEDPLSRGATEWERYAAQLAGAGRFREAIRAWYHAVLVTCYSAGVLNFRKGRTNWEYVATLAPSVEWRPEMIELTRRFEKEWYGHEQSAPDALEQCSELARSILESLRRRGAA